MVEFIMDTINKHLFIREYVVLVTLKEISFTVMWVSVTEVSGLCHVHLTEDIDKFGIRSVTTE